MRHVLSTALIASSLIVGVAAQGQEPAAPPAAPRQAAKVTISGCIQTPAPEAPATGAAAPAASLSKFDLSNAKMIGSAPVGTTGAPPAATRYRLEGDEKTISPHLNHQVEITGTVSPATAASVVGATAAAPMLKIEAVKMIAAKCSS